MMTKTYEVRLSGSGGQGLILAGIILARAAVLENRKVLKLKATVQNPEVDIPMLMLLLVIGIFIFPKQRIFPAS
jgi:hypothetical protein